MNKKICLIGASFETGNLGVSALAWSSIKLILSRWPDANISIVGSGRKRDRYEYRIDGKSCNIQLFPVRYSPRIWIRDHIVWIWFWVMLFKLLPFAKSLFQNKSSTLSELLGADVICDITGGDSFSDIYGLQRLFRGCLLKRICQMTGCPFVMLPQTYGPFKRRLAKLLAGRVLKKSTAIYSRDNEGLDAVRQLIGVSDKVMLCPDVAFMLDVVRPDDEQAERIDKLKNEGIQIIGLNISGLLYNGGYTRDNMFGLAGDYRELIKDIILQFNDMDNTIILLVPHVIPEDFEVENDLTACREIFDKLTAAQKEKVIVLDGNYDQNRIKYFIGLCDFFMGSRMHSTIAAISQCVPAAGLAYSKKFAGVFQTASVSECVVDLKLLDNRKVLEKIRELFSGKEGVRAKLESKIPEIKVSIKKIFDGIQI